MSQISEKWGEALARHMNRTQISDRQLATFLGSIGFEVHHTTVGRWRKGMVPKHGVGMVPALASYFDCPVSDFVEDAHQGEVGA